MNNEFIEGVFGGRECTNNTYLFGEEYGGINTTCQSGTYYEVECIIAPTSYPTQSPTTAYPTTSWPTEVIANETEKDPTENDSKANIISICIAFIYANVILFITL